MKAGRGGEQERDSQHLWAENEETSSTGSAIARRKWDVKRDVQSSREGRMLPEWLEKARKKEGRAIDGRKVVGGKPVLSDSTRGVDVMCCVVRC